jgi:hypothetical protein
MISLEQSLQDLLLETATVEKRIEQILAAISDAGYVQVTKNTEFILRLPMKMTGQDWYERFEVEVDKLTNADGYYYKYRASGINPYYNDYYLEAARQATVTTAAKNSPDTTTGVEENANTTNNRGEPWEGDKTV